MRLRLEYGPRDTLRFWREMYPPSTRTFYEVCVLAILGIVAMYAAHLVPLLQPAMLSFWLYLAGLLVLGLVAKIAILLVLMNVGHWRANERKNRAR